MVSEPSVLNIGSSRTTALRTRLCKQACVISSMVGTLRSAKLHRVFERLQFRDGDQAISTFTALDGLQAHTSGNFHPCFALGQQRFRKIPYP